ncbi:MAG: hypothetical protein D6737_09585 [Chloroflexi bacterium]|nr:MAG: hypothetical protein D6737_09585 [Chloroflexota bacterium]
MRLMMIKLASLYIVVFALLIGFIHAQPYDSNGLRDFLLSPDGCPAPCFIGIRPGVTTEAEAIAILETHPWVESIEIFDNNFFGGANIAFEWGDFNLAFNNGLISSSIVTGADGRVVQIQIPLTTPFYQALLEMGRPDHFEVTEGTIAGNTFDGFVRGNRAHYTESGILLTTEHLCIITAYSGAIPGAMECPVSQQVVWKMHTEIIISKPEE